MQLTDALLISKLVETGVPHSPVSSGCERGCSKSSSGTSCLLGRLSQMGTAHHFQSCKRDRKFVKFHVMRESWYSSVSIVARILADRPVNQISIFSRSDRVRSILASYSEGPEFKS
jgi:hypothetical protein